MMRCSDTSALHNGDVFFGFDSYWYIHTCTTVCANHFEYHCRIYFAKSTRATLVVCVYNMVHATYSGYAPHSYIISFLI